MAWIYKDNQIIATKEDLPENVFGFVYRIDNLSKLDEQGNYKFYIGRKNIYSNTAKKLSKKQLEARTDKRSSKKVTITKESNWSSYTSSNKELNDDIAGGDRINKTILEFASTKLHLTYLEMKYQFIHGVLETLHCYNNNIAGKLYRTIFDFKYPKDAK